VLPYGNTCGTSQLDGPQGEEMIGESVAKFWAIGSRPEYASRLGV